MNTDMQKYFKDTVLRLHGYSSPPQVGYKVKLNQNESPFDVPEKIKSECLQKALQLDWNRYPENESPALKAKLAELDDVDTEQILLGSGSNQILQTLLNATIESGDRVVITPPTFSLWELWTGIYHAENILVPHVPGDDYPLQDVLQAIEQSQPKIVFMCSPNNPTGYQTSLDALKAVCEAAPGLVFWDEAYVEFTDQTAVPLLDKYENLLISRTFSKAYSMAGLRFGYFIANAAVIAELRKCNIPYNVNILTEHIAMTVLDCKKEMAEAVAYLIDERDHMAAEMQKMKNLTVYPSAANFLLIKGPDHIDLFSELKEHSVLVRDVSSYPMLKDHQRVSVGFKEENDFFLNALQKILNK